MPFSSKLMNCVAVIMIMGICLTLLEYIAGICLLKFMNLRLWDYSNNKWNIQGVICPFYSFGWTVLGIFIIDFIYSSKLIIKIKKYAHENEIIVRVETLKTQVRSFHNQHQ